MSKLGIALCREDEGVWDTALTITYKYNII